VSITVHDINLADVLHICQHLPESERAVYEKLSGLKYAADHVAAEVFKYRGMPWVLRDEHGPIVACGFAHQRDGVLQTWFLATDRAWSEHGRAVTDWARDTIKAVLDARLAHRIETLTLASETSARQWYAKLGLQHESTLRGYCSNGDDAVMYVAVRTPESA